MLHVAMFELENYAYFYLPGYAVYWVVISQLGHGVREVGVILNLYNLFNYGDQHVFVNVSLRQKTRCFRFCQETSQVSNH